MGTAFRASGIPAVFPRSIPLREERYRPGTDPPTRFIRQIRILVYVDAVQANLA